MLIRNEEKDKEVEEDEDFIFIKERLTAAAHAFRMRESQLANIELERINHKRQSRKTRERLQNIKSIFAENGYQKALQAEKGAYIVKKSDKPDIVLLANGSEVSTLLSAIPILEEKGLKIQVVSAPSEGLFFNQSEDYRKEVLPVGVPVFGLTAGLPSTLQRFIKDNGKVFGLSHFGYSAPYTVLDEKFGFTAENVVKEVMEMLK
jgi:transketolase